MTRHGTPIGNDESRNDFWLSNESRGGILRYTNNNSNFLPMEDEGLFVNHLTMPQEVREGKRCPHGWNIPLVG